MKSHILMIGMKSADKRICYYAERCINTDKPEKNKVELMFDPGTWAKVLSNISDLELKSNIYSELATDVDMLHNGCGGQK